MSRKQLVECPLSLESAEPFEPELAEGAEDPELPEGWVQLSLQKVVPNPEFEEAVKLLVEQYIQAAQQQPGAEKQDLNKMRVELTAAVRAGDIAADLPDRHLLEVTEEHFSPDAFGLIKTALAALKLPQLSTFFE